jgi:tRNA U34 2-thiouridine synthase MnmA/TrmU
MTVGQRRGVLPARDGERRYVAQGDLADDASRSVDSRRSSSTRSPRRDSLSFSHDELVDGHAVLAQWSAHGRRAERDAATTGRWRLELDVQPARPVAAGQSVVLYRASEPTIVEGAAIVAGREPRRARRATARRRSRAQRGVLHVHDAPTIPDADYDALARELRSSRPNIPN